MSKFKFGDMVRVLGSESDDIPVIKAMIGKTCEIKEIDEAGDYWVYQEDKSNAWCFYGSELELVQEKPVDSSILDSIRGWLVWGEGPRSMATLCYQAWRHPLCSADDIPESWQSFDSEMYVTKDMYAEVLYRAFKRAEANLVFRENK